MKNAIRKAALPLMLSCVMFAGSVSAQSASPASASSSAASPSTTKTHMQKRADAVEQQISDLRSQLNITEAQSKPWDAYAQTMRDNARKAADAFHDRAQNLPTMNADDVMKSYAKLAQMHADDMQKLSSAWSDVYSALTPEQKQTADALFQNKATKAHSMQRGHKSMKPASASSSSSSPST